MKYCLPLLVLPLAAFTSWLVDSMGDHGRPFVELGNEGFLVGLERRF